MGRPNPTHRRQLQVLTATRDRQQVAPSLALRFACLNALGFVATTMVPTWVDAHFEHVAYHVRVYSVNLGWLSVLAGAVALAQYTILRVFSRSGWSYLASVVPLLTCIPLLIWNFWPEVPHPHVTGWVLCYTLANLIAIYVYRRPSCLQAILSRSGSTEARLERVKAELGLWEKASIGVAIGYLALLVPWFNCVADRAKAIAAKPQGVDLILGAHVVAIAVFSVFFVCAILSETLGKYAEVADQFLGADESGPTEPSSPRPSKAESEGMAG